MMLSSMYLTGDAKLWWRTRSEDDVRPKIQTWEMLKRELKEQFLLGNTSWVARESLKRLRQTGSVRDYVKEFSSLMLDIKNISEEDVERIWENVNLIPLRVEFINIYTEGNNK